MDERKYWPNDLNAELTVVGAIVAKPELLASVSGIVEAGHFNDSACRMIWKAIVDLGKQQRPISDDEIVMRIEETGGFSNVDCGDAKSVRECVEVTLADFDGFPKEARWAAWRIRESALRRQLLAATGALKESLIGGPPTEIKSRIQKLIELSRELEQASSAAEAALAALNADTERT
ncbi:MAG TPA: DnaB-like helicase N-terminal domain-containing protein [Pyrinomonadaceae bacterium]|nr:DnaB-like helicase N-terminal domain-containing protein [Pyrinomonadaceae bacterium]